MTEPANHNPLPPKRSVQRWQFGLPALLGTLMLLCLPFALWGAVLRANQADQFWLMILCAAVPVGVMVLMAVVVEAGRRLRKRRRNSAAPLDDETWA